MTTNNSYPLLDDFQHQSNKNTNSSKVIVVVLSSFFCIVNPVFSIFLGQQSEWIDLIWVIPAYTVISFAGIFPFALGYILVMGCCMFIYSKLKWKVLDLLLPLFRIPDLFVKKVQYTGFWLIAHIMIFGLLIYLGFTDSTQIDFRF